jgi:coenzyme F420-reducing hydrogenase beta subunit
MVLDEEGFLYPVIDQANCSNCGECLSVCPASNPIPQNSLVNIYFGWHKNESIRLNSSSGGAFSAIAEKVLGKNGVIFGAIYDNSLKRVIHICSDKIDYTKQRKSKYVESDLMDTFSETKEYLESGKQVLFCSTPCQIQGLKKYLDKDYNNLLTCDFLCHGVPSAKILNDHLISLEKRYKSNIIDIDFRPKTYGWRIQALKIYLKNGKRRVFPIQQDYFLQGFFVNNLFFRKSCYSCEFRENHASDITLGDFWGIDKYDPSFNDGKGISLLLVNSIRGQNTIEQISDNFISHPLEYKHVAYCFKKRNPTSYSIEKRSKFFDKYLKSDYEKTIKEFIHINKPIARCKFILRRIMNKFPIVSSR